MLAFSEVDKTIVDACKVVWCGKANFGNPILLNNFCVIRIQLQLNFEIIFCVGRALKGA
jgi:hypothetical protein